MKTNYIKRLKSFILSPIFPVLFGILLGTIIIIFYVIYCTPVSLCDDALDLQDLKDKLDYEV